MARKPSSPNAKYTFAVDPAKRALVGKKTRQARRKISGGPAESAERRLVFGFATRDSWFISRSTRDEKVFAVGKTTRRFWQSNQKLRH
jgi:hypothetical protein